jgi:3-dehydroquinate synthase
VLATLPRREFRAGLYEVVKYGVIASRELFDTVRGSLKAVFAREPAVLQPIIAACCRIKARIVSEDERESGPRRVLNFGHTAGHALEAITRYRRFRHGEAVAYGMLVAAAIARARGLLAGAAGDELAALLMELGPRPPVADLSAREALDAMRHDKKIVDGRLHVVLPVEIGRTAIVNDVSTVEMEHALRFVGLGP